MASLVQWFWYLRYCGYLANFEFCTRVGILWGVFIAVSILWSMKFDGFKPDAYDIMGA